MTVKRYEMDHKGLPFEDARGSFVLYGDYAALERERDALAAENAALKSAHPQPFGREMMRALDAYEKHQDEVPETGMLNAFFILRDSINLQTPVTEAMLSHVWTEGSEPSAFGRYWVRYESPVGPQYCSAEWMEHNFCASSDTNIHKIWLADHSRSISPLKGVTHYTKLPDPVEHFAAELRKGAAV